MLVFIKGSPRESAYLRSVGGLALSWGPQEHLLASLIDVVNMQRYEHPPSVRPTGPRPERITRPGERPAGTQLGADPIPISQFNDWWDS